MKLSQVEKDYFKLLLKYMIYGAHFYQVETFDTVNTVTTKVSIQFPLCISSHQWVSET